MDIKDIRSFMECYENRSLNRAAKSLYITPQGLGKSIDRLEHDLQVQLFDRTKQGLVPTEAGVFFYGKSQRIMEYVQDLEQGLDAIRNKSRLFRVGYSCGLVRMLPMERMEAFQKAHPDTDVVWEEGSNQDIKTKLIRGQLDIALVIGRVAATDYAERELTSKTMCAVVPKGHAFYEKEELHVADLQQQQLISLNEKYQSYSNLISSCEGAGFYPNIRIKTMEASMIYRFVEEGLGIGIDVDIHEKEHAVGETRLIPIADGIPWNVNLSVEKKREREPLMQEFIKTFFSA